MLQLHVYTVDGVVRWVLVKLRPASEWRSSGPEYWRRSGHLVTDESPQSDREALSLVFRELQNRLGER